MNKPLLEIEVLNSLPIKEPAKRWVNWYNVLAPIDLYVRGKFHSATDPGIRCGAILHPSKDLAEQVWVEGTRKNPVNIARLEYLGAFPEGERP